MAKLARTAAPSLSTILLLLFAGLAGCDDPATPQDPAATAEDGASADAKPDASGGGAASPVEKPAADGDASADRGSAGTEPADDRPAAETKTSDDQPVAGAEPPTAEPTSADSPSDQSPTGDRAEPAQPPAADEATEGAKAGTPPGDGAEDMQVKPGTPARVALDPLPRAAATAAEEAPRLVVSVDGYRPSSSGPVQFVVTIDCAGKKEEVGRFGIFPDAAFEAGGKVAAQQFGFDMPEAACKERSEAVISVEPSTGTGEGAVLTLGRVAIE
ncbi:hypothetical protein E3C22_08375 [Jiella endophytica]|uniref:Lipoprotein n=1 Tax=Jiella endophytica TaxID=2558362 RepID=A0A4Y8RQJ5_9HYPH|nr:hypothetical protein [Jiella endophytica]TFF25365.1 hypothetical protein E3C22_08375 [Jiella endophytica]